MNKLVIVHVSNSNGWISYQGMVSDETITRCYEMDKHADRKEFWSKEFNIKIVTGTALIWWIEE